MFRASPSSRLIDLFSNVQRCLPLHGQKKLNDPNAWQNLFLDHVTRRIPEERFAELFDDTTGRPNAPLRLLIGMLILKEGFGWGHARPGETPRGSGCSPFGWVKAPLCKLRLVKL